MYSLSLARKMMAPAPTSRAFSLPTWAAASSFDVPCVIVSALPSMKMLSFLARGRLVFCAWANARLETLDVRAIVVATMIADLYLDPVILVLLCAGNLAGAFVSR